MSPISDYSKFEQNYNTKNKKPQLILIKIIILALLITPIIYLFTGKKSSATNFINPLAESLMETGDNLLNPENKSTILEKLVLRELDNAEGEYAVAIKNLMSGEEYFYNKDKTFETASLYKLFVMAVALEQIQSGTLDPNRVLSQDIPILNEKFGIATESAELTEGSITMKVNDAITKMITISDNYAALLLTEAVRISNISNFLIENDLSSTKMGNIQGNPTTTASDMLKFLERLHEGNLTEANNTKAMLTILKNQQLNGKIPKYLPENIEVAHKTGELGRLSHDAGIVYHSKGNFIIVILTQTSVPLEANEKISVIAKGVFDHFSN